MTQQEQQRLEDEHYNGLVRADKKRWWTISGVIIAVFIGGFVISNASCKDQAKPVASSGNDTTRTIVTYVYNANENIYKTGAAVRYEIDSIKPDPKDKTRNITVRDTIYNLALFEPVRDTTGKVTKVGDRDSMILRWVGVNPSLILQDFNRDYTQYLPKTAQ